MSLNLRNVLVEERRKLFLDIAKLSLYFDGVVAALFVMRIAECDSRFT